MSKRDELIDDFTNLDYGFSRLKIDRNRSDGIFLNIFDAGGIRYLMKKCGLHDHLKKKRFYPYTIIVFRDENDIHNLRILESERNVPLVDLRVSEKRFVKTGFDGQTLSFDMVAIEWLSTRDPRLFTFKSNRPQLPGQTHPSLGCLSLMMKMMYLCSRRIHKDAFMDVPDHLHLALMYSSFFHFLDPAAEAVIRAVKRGLKGYSLSEIAWGAVTGSIFDKKTGELFVYKPSEQLYPVSRRMKRYFSSKSYQEAVKNSNPGQFTLNRDNLNKKIESAKKKYL
ncbi:MAG: hypothetical protein JXK07_12780 [Spirochaetes bacterium]|nr:hypothetical protein [Spirochaetota bacterium]MBN2770506.1 hypothetical protein [Spirochaetota bacterium]